MNVVERIPLRPAGFGPAARTRVVADVMTRDVARLSPETPIPEAWYQLLGQALPGLPVVDTEDRVVGVLGEHDLLGRLAARRRRPWWDLLVDTERLAREYRKAVGLTVGEVMTAPAPTISSTADLQAAARLFDAPALTAVPVVAGPRLVGVLCRRNLVGALAPAPAGRAWLPDPDLVIRMQEAMAREAWISKPRPVVDACDGVLALWGIVGGEAEKAALITMARAIPGCRGVEDHLIARGSRYHRHALL
jgi:CBS-domain-containing membrane protein